MNAILAFKFWILNWLRRTPLLLLVLLASGNVSAADEPPIDATVFFSKEDPHWPEAEKVIDGVAKKFPRIRITKTSIDDEAGYKQLAAAEERNLIKDSGDLTLIMGPLALTSKGKRRDVETYFEPMVTRLLDPNAAKGRLKADVPAFVKEVFGADAAAQMLPPEADDNILYFRVQQGGKDVGWVADAFKAIACPVCNDVQTLIATDSEFKVIALKPVRELEKWGAPLDEKTTAGFTAQFKDKLPKDEIKVDGISSATKTTRAYEYVVSEALKHLQRAAAK